MAIQALGAPKTHRLDPLSALSQVWRAAELGRADSAVLPTGHAALDAQLPGGGWPLGAMVELLQPRPGAHEWELLLPALARLARAQRGVIVLVGAPHLPFGPALAARGLPPERLLLVEAAAGAARLWACEQALRCADAAAVLAWLPQARSDALRRLHRAAQAGTGLFFVLRPAAVRHESSAAPLRLLLGGTDALTIEIVKRRGPPLPAPLALSAQPAPLIALLAASRAGRRASAPASSAPASSAPPASSALPSTLPAAPGRVPAGAFFEPGTDHALDRVAAAA
ncbi:MAG: translesion DNA synthesis-associated protein ImuA [Proteobacteria bacterium]|nr:translesion DNA synthesis-associated protein ImuA [Pseudomonadota bacterium]